MDALVYEDATCRGKRSLNFVRHASWLRRFPFLPSVLSAAAASAPFFVPIWLNDYHNITFQVDLQQLSLVALEIYK
jgi:hypothetical protein